MRKGGREVNKWEERGPVRCGQGGLDRSINYHRHP